MSMLELVRGQAQVLADGRRRPVIMALCDGEWSLEDWDALLATASNAIVVQPRRHGAVAAKREGDK